MQLAAQTVAAHPLAIASADTSANAQAANLVSFALGLPADRQARLAARRAFVALKLSFMYAVDGLPEQANLRRQVRLAESLDALWAMRAPVFAALSGTDAVQTGRRQLLHRSLDSMFGPCTLMSEVGDLGSLNGTEDLRVRALS